MKTKIMVTTALALTLIAGCKKNNETNPIQPEDSASVEGLAQTAKLTLVPQKIYNLTEKQCYEMIKTFKSSSVQSFDPHARVIVTSDLTVDSANFVLEAALNYDFDKAYDNNYAIGERQFSATVPLTSAGTIPASNLQAAYLHLTDSINSALNPSLKVLSVDVAVYTSGTGTVVFTIGLKTMYVTNYFPCGNPNVYASPYRSLLINCSGTPAYDACTVLNQRLNCIRIVVGGCVYGYYYTNVVTQQFNPSWGTADPYPNVLFSAYPYASTSSGFKTLSNWCGTPIVSLSPAQLNTYYNGILNFVASNTPSSPAGLVVFTTNLTPGSNVAVSNSNQSYYSLYWQLAFSTGKRTCRPSMPSQ